MHVVLATAAPERTAAPCSANLPPPRL